MPDPRSTRLANLALALSVSVVMASALEWGARAYERRHPPPSPAEYLWDWERMWDGDFYTVASASAGWPPWEEFNADGVRDRTHAVEKLPRATRVVFLGDSVTLGDGLPPAQAYPQVLQARFDREQRPIEIFNVALWGWSTRQQRLAFERIAKRYRPDVVVLAVCLNDIPELQNNLTRPPAWLTSLHAASALVRLLVNASGREIQSVEQLFEQPAPPRVEQAFARFFEEVRGLRRDVEQSGARFALIVFPFRFQLEADPPPALVQARLTSFWEAERIVGLDLLPGLRELGPEAFRDYDHLSVAGAEAVAKLLAGAALWPPVPAPAEQFGTLAPTSRALVVAELDSGDPGRREAALRWLGAGATPSQIEAALLDPDAGLRCAAILLLAERGATAARPKLFELLADGSESVRHAAALALARLGPEASEDRERVRAALLSEDAYVRAFAAWTAGEWGAAARPLVPNLVELLPREEAQPGVALQALAKLGEQAAEAAPAVLVVLRSPQPRRRWTAASTLGRLGPGARAAAGPELRAVLKDDGDARVRAQAALALGRLLDASAASVAALDLALVDEDANVRALAARALGWLGSPALPAVARLNGLLSDADPRAQKEARKALRRIQLGTLADGDDPRGGEDR